MKLEPTASTIHIEVFEWMKRVKKKTVALHKNNGPTRRKKIAYEKDCDKNKDRSDPAERVADIYHCDQCKKQQQQQHFVPLHQYQ